VNANMSQAVRRTTAGKGIDPNEMVMLAYGGNGPVFAAIQADDLGIEKVLVPKASPTFSALGTLAASPSIDEERSYRAAANELDLKRLELLWTELDRRAGKYFAEAGFPRGDVQARYQMKMRYPGQNWALTFDIFTCKGLEDLSFITDAISAQAIEAFNKRHIEEFGHVREGEIPEITGVRLVTSVETPSPKVTRGFTAPTVIAKAARTRRANLGQGFKETPIFRGADLEPGHEVVGPAVIEETFTTIVVYPGWKAHMDDAGDYELTRVR
jgi:N-methylhydantoinase A